MQDNSEQALDYNAGLFRTGLMGTMQDNSGQALEDNAG
jgi:hypothetical protein